MTLQWAQWLQKSDPTKSQCSWSKLCLVFTWNLKKKQSGCMSLLNWGRLLEFPDLIKIHFWLLYWRPDIRVEYYLHCCDGLCLTHNLVYPSCCRQLHWICSFWWAMHGKLLSKQLYFSLHTENACNSLCHNLSGFCWTHVPWQVFLCAVDSFLFLCIFLGSVYQTVYLCWQLQRGQCSSKCSGAFIWSSLWSLLPTFKVTISVAR